MRPTTVLPRPPRPDLRAGAASREPLRLRPSERPPFLLPQRAQRQPARRQRGSASARRRASARRLHGHLPAARRRRGSSTSGSSTSGSAITGSSATGSATTASSAIGSSLDGLLDGLRARPSRPPRSRAPPSTGSLDGLVPSTGSSITGSSITGSSTTGSAVTASSLDELLHVCATTVSTRAPACAAGSSARACRTAPSHCRRLVGAGDRSSTIWGSSAAGSS